MILLKELIYSNDLERFREPLRRYMYSTFPKEYNQKQLLMFGLSMDNLIDVFLDKILKIRVDVTYTDDRKQMPHGNYSGETNVITIGDVNLKMYSGTPKYSEYVDGVIFHELVHAVNFHKKLWDKITYDALTMGDKYYGDPEEERAYRAQIEHLFIKQFGFSPKQAETMMNKYSTDQSPVRSKWMAKYSKEKMTETIQTLRGSPVRRYKNLVGKLVGEQLYVHKKYAAEVVPNEQLKFAAELLKQLKPGFRFNSIMWNRKTGEIRFDEAPDFDTAREPHVGKYISVYPNGMTREGDSNNVWHHKWLWVKDDYKGFDVDKAKKWSKLWLSKLNQIAKGTDKSFGTQLQKHGLGEQLMNEVTQDEAALDFLKQKVQMGPFRGQVYLAGGAVRDMIRGEKPKDLDVVVTNHGKNGGMDFAVWLAQQMGNYKAGSNPVLFPNFGTAKVNLSGTHQGVDLTGFEVEAVFARKEVYTPGSRKPEVFPGTIEDDAYRRDFTVNSMMLDLTTDEILDITGKGRADIKAGIIRSTSNPDEIFGQDALRMFRAVRFATKYNWNIEPGTWEGIKKNLNQLVTNNTSRERIRDELDKMLATKNPRRAFELMRELGLLPYVAPEFQQMVGMTQNVHHTDDVFNHTMAVLQGTKPDQVTRLIALFHDIGKVVTRAVTPKGVQFIGHEKESGKKAEQIMRSLKYPVDLIKLVRRGVEEHMKLKHGGDDAVKLSDDTLRRFYIKLGDTLEQVLDVIHADNVSHAGPSSMPNQIENVRRRLAALNIQVKQPELPYDGDQLQSIFGVPEGEGVGIILNIMTNLWYKNGHVSKRDAEHVVKSVMPQLNKLIRQRKEKRNKPKV